METKLIQKLYKLIFVELSSTVSFGFCWINLLEMNNH